jgi:signal transduction histidine kinase
VPALEWLSDHAAKTRGLDVEVKAANGRAELPEDMAVLLFRSVSELLNNVAKHANTSHATVSMQVGEGEAVLVVSDEGEGFDPGLGDQTGRRAGGFGLFSVRERLKAVGGDVEIESRRGLGTRVTLRIPLSTS